MASETFPSHAFVSIPLLLGRRQIARYCHEVLLSLSADLLYFYSSSASSSFWHYFDFTELTTSQISVPKHPTPSPRVLVIKLYRSFSPHIFTVRHLLQISGNSGVRFECLNRSLTSLFSRRTMRLFHRHRNKKKNPPLPIQEDLFSPLDSPSPLPPIRNFSYPTAALQPPLAPPIFSSAQAGIHLPPTSFGEAQTSTLSSGIEPPFYWASSYRSIRKEEEGASTDSQSYISDTGPEAFVYG
ncbi:uncharacterized protein BDZ83DRAFT_331215 [Colletotrichum acutatum]|uniref:Uncharacterized protein n=1 Tax=Glomerella acutata TaxID=27357 RepID=A0AAD8XNE9_GLOAC|nr:uncharacterized protein BDZ83DRAFT_331215 [Colletotrichum acutatum]KAK1730685.1 hypothetical protein BDZ83DRAFT_331215 [Colletotrichum acutatum]